MLTTAECGNKLYEGDNLEILRVCVADESIDLAYLDPPFNTNSDFKLSGNGDEGPVPGRTGEAFRDSWRWDENSQASFLELIRDQTDASKALHGLRLVLGDADGTLAYLTMMAPRLVELRRVVKSSGSVFLHCDPRTSHYLKLLMDSIFGRENFRNEIIWYYGGRGAKAIARQFARNHDVILFYSRCAAEHVFYRQHGVRRFDRDAARRRGFKQDAEGSWFKTAPRGDYTEDSLRRLEAEDRIYRTRSGTPRVKYRLATVGDDVVESTLVGDTWLDVPDGMHIGKERLGYPTQKPEALLERVIESCSREGDIVLDPFCGSGTTLSAAQQLGRGWIGIDKSAVAIQVSRKRLGLSFPSQHQLGPSL